MARKKATEIQLLDALGENFVDYFTELEFVVDNQDEDGRGAIDRWGDPNAVGSTYTLSSTAFVPVTAAFMALAVSSDPTGTAHWNMDGIPWTGTVLLSNASHSNNRGQLQSQKIMLKGKGAPVSS